jgi:hypothetical protein
MDTKNGLRFLRFLRFQEGFCRHGTLGTGWGGFSPHTQGSNVFFLRGTLEFGTLEIRSKNKTKKGARFLRFQNAVSVKSTSFEGPA